MQRSLTGIQPSGTLHLGNYLGSIKPALSLQERYRPFYFIADYHALTSVEDPTVVRRGSLSIAASFLACGFDPDKGVLFRQSAVPEVCELTWILSCMIPVGMLERGHAVKAAQDGGREINAGVLYYPVLMAADILLYDTSIVPVGKDQKQHVEMCRDMAQRMNHRFGDDTLVVPEVSIREDVGLVPGLDGRKMSKSYGNVLPLWDTPKRLRKKIMKIVTDSQGIDDVKDPDSCNVFALYKLFATEEEQAELREKYANPPFGYGHAKQALFEVIDRELAPKRERYEQLMEHPEEIEAVLSRGAEEAGREANSTIARVRERVGLR